MRRLFLLIALMTLSVPALSSGASPVSPEPLRVEPPHWWVGMAEPRLQLLVQAPGIGRASVRVDGTDTVLESQQSLASPNYLVLNLRVGRQAGDLNLHFSRDGQTRSQRYSLRARTPGSAQREGFGPKDAIYLLVPDRFAQGGSGVQGGMREGVDRANPGGRHGGDLAGMRRGLAAIADLGFTQVWPTPLLENDSPKYSYHGYAATDFYRIDPRFGSHADYLGFVADARRLGIGVIQDVVLNHMGSGHRWMQDLPDPDWLNQWPQYTETSHARMSLQDPHGAPSDQARFERGWFTRTMPDLNQRHPVLATYLTQMSVWWVEEAGLSGIRTDTYSYSERAFLTQWSERLMREYPKLNIVGEEWSPHPAVVSYWQRGKKNHDGYVSHTPSLMDFPLHGALLAALTEGDGHDSGFTKLYEALAHDFVYPAPEQLVLFGGNHDTPRLFTVLKQDLQLWKMAVAYLGFVSRIPQWFYGDELLFTSPAQRDDGRVRADYLGGWAGDKVSAFSGAGLSPAQQEAQAFTRAVFQLRKGEPLLHKGALMHYAPDTGTGSYALFRYAKDQPNAPRLMLLLNKNPQPIAVDLERYPEMASGFVPKAELLRGDALQLSGRSLRVPARSASLVWLERRP